ncbi:MAG: glycosyltransferase family 4 protein [Planctomycetes bacterium]|nr:glycosyltransferase family 4 protein [Planctomycetota bacterium]
MRICVVTSPRPKAGILPLSNLIDVLSNLSSSLSLITGNAGEAIFKSHKNVRGYSMTFRSRTTLPGRVVHFVSLQIKFAYAVARWSRKTDAYIFFMGEGLLMSVLAVKLSRKKVILHLAASQQKIDEATGDIFSRPFRFFEVLNYALADKIIVYSTRLINEWGLQAHKNKILIAHEHYLDFDRFKITKPVGEREDIIGFVGRIRAEKGIMQFVETIPKILSVKSNTKFVIVGEGPLAEQVEQYIDRNKLKSHVQLIGWISHDDLPESLNEFKLVVLPSYTEGLPNVMLEAMACGTPVLATPVGTIPDMIKDGETGFILEDNSSECIGSNIVRALDHPGLERISKNARDSVEGKFTYNVTVDEYSKVVSSL